MCNKDQLVYKKEGKKTHLGGIHLVIIIAVWCYSSGGGGARSFSVFLGATIVVNSDVKCVLTRQSSFGSGGSVVVAEKQWR